MPMIAMPSPQWNARAKLPQLDEVFRIMSRLASRGHSSLLPSPFAGGNGLP
jgi:hypothetical protein